MMFPWCLQATFQSSGQPWGAWKQLCPSLETSKVIESALLLAKEIGKEEQSEEHLVFSIRSTDVFSINLHN